MHHQHLSSIVDTTKSQFTKLKPVPSSAVKLTDRFWAPRLQTNRLISLRMQYRKLADTGRLDNFRRASGKRCTSYTEPVFNDSDVYKWLEATAWTLATESDHELWLLVDKTINEVLHAQRADGYLNTYYTLDRQHQRWTNIRDMHELYCAGHLIQAAVALHRCIGDTRLLESAIRFADYLVSQFSLSKQRELVPPGHPEIEMALVELSRETDDKRYLQLAQRFLDSRGKGLIGGREYHLDHQPFRDLQRLTGHAVRALYLCSGATDIALETGEQTLKHTLQQLWQHMTTHLMYITGGVGARHNGEAIGSDYELPNAQAYAETCASIAMLMWSWRLLQMDANCQYADYMEHLLYNAILSGVSLDGKSYFYVNPLMNDGIHRRESWFDCACCPPNIARTLAMMPGYIYSVSQDTVWVHQYATNESTLTLPGGDEVSILQRTRYPWNGNVIIEILDNCTLSLNLRIPGWCEKDVKINVNGDTYTQPVTPGTYVRISRSWSVGDSVCLQFDMPIRRMRAHPYVRENTGQVALMRGPLLFCVEAVDNPDVNLFDIVLQTEQTLTSSFRPDILNGVQIIESPVVVESPDDEWHQSLYREKQETHTQKKTTLTMTAIPYFAWGNRAAGQMLVWLHENHDAEKL